MEKMVEHSLVESRWQDIETKKEVTENFYFDEERCDYINDVKQEKKMEYSLGKSRWQDIEIKKEVTENFYFDEERCDYINDVKQEKKMEYSLGQSRWQDIEIKREVTENFYFDEERCDYINDVKQEHYDQNEIEPISGVAIIKLEQKGDLREKDNDLTFPNQFQKRNDSTTYDCDTHILETEYDNNPSKIEPYKIITIQVKPKLSFCKICKKTCYSNSKFNQHQSKVQCGQKPYSCLLCERSYSEKSILSMHEIIVHGPDQILNNSYYTKYSQPTLLKLRNYNGSSMKHTKSLNLQNYLPNCFVCNIVFGSKDDLSNHRIHSLIHKVNLLVKSLK